MFVTVSFHDQEKCIHVSPSPTAQSNHGPSLERFHERLGEHRVLTNVQPYTRAVAVASVKISRSGLSSIGHAPILVALVRDVEKTRERMVDEM